MRTYRSNAHGALAVWRWVITLAILTGMLLVIAPGRAHAAPPPANAVIGNQATASYTDNTGNTRTSTSNLVQTTVQQVYSHTLTADNSIVVAPGNTVYFPHALTNTGNGNDTFALSTAQLTTDNFDLGSVQIFADANGDGQPDNATPITSTGSVAAGQVFKFVVAGAVPQSQADATNAQVRVGAFGNASDTNNYTASTTAPNGAQQGSLDTAKVSVGAVVSVTKSYSATTGAASNTLTVTLNYVNNGTGSAPVRHQNRRFRAGPGHRLRTLPAAEITSGQQAQNIGPRTRFAQVAVEADLEAAPPAIIVVVGREGINLTWRFAADGLQLADCPQCLETIHDRHFQVHENDIGVINPAQFEGRASIFRGLHVERRAGQ